MAPQNQKPTSSRAARTARREAAQAELRKVQAQQRRNRLLWTGAVVVIVVAIFAVVAVFGLKHKGDSGAATTAAPAKLTKAVTTIPAATYDKVGTGTTSAAPKLLTDATALTKDGKPQVLYVGAEYCPYCAAERWAVVSALSRFGTFQNLGQTASTPNDVYPNTPTLSFHGSSYTSKYLVFTGYETQDTDGKALDKLPNAEGEIFTKYDAPPYFPGDNNAGSIPFIDFGGKYALQGVSYNPQLLAGLTHQEVADQILDPSTKVSQSVLGTANTLTAAVCRLTHNQPAKVCSSSAVAAAGASLQQ